MTGKAILRVSALAAALTLSLPLLPSGTAQARDRGRACETKVNKQERKLDQAVRRHGVGSRQAEKERRKLADIQNRCGSRYRDRRR